MANVLITWELGAGLGHLTRLRPVIQRLVEQGHAAHLAVRDLSSVHPVFGEIPLRLYQAPIKIGKSAGSTATPVCFAHILQNCGFQQASELIGRLRAWQHLFDTVAPDLLLHDHSPPPLAAVRGTGIPQAIIGTGFICPPATDPLPSLRPWLPQASADHTKAEAQTLATVNQALAACAKPELASLGGLYAVDQVLLTTFKELDHYGERPGIRYWGAWPAFPGRPPEWPEPTHGKGKKIFAYLKRSPGLSDLLKHLRQLGHATIVYGSWVTDEIQSRHAGPTLQLSQEPLDLQQVAAEADLAILNGTHGTSAAMLLGGTPTLQLPIFLEQRLLAERICRFGAGLVANRKNVSDTITRLHQMLGSTSYADRAQRFAEIYRRVSPSRQFDKMMDALETLLPDRSPQNPSESA